MSGQGAIILTLFVKRMCMKYQTAVEMFVIMTIKKGIIIGKEKRPKNKYNTENSENSFFHLRYALCTIIQLNRYIFQNKRRLNDFLRL